MAFNDRMHPRNIYKNRKLDFDKLAEKYTNFKNQIEVNDKGKIKVDFKDPAHVRAVTWALLKDDFDLDVSIPLTRLIPTVPLRLNYILWIEDLFNFKDSSILSGIDVGCGSSCIYSLLGAKMNSWKFLAADADTDNYNNALKNVGENQLTNLVSVKKVSSTSTLSDILGLSGEINNYDFCMCNPPFFENNMDLWGITNSRSKSRPGPKHVNTSCELESIFPGGEVEFVKKVIIQPSLELKDCVKIYTTMLGKKTSVKILMSFLRTNNVDNISTTEFCQGNTMRWGLAWSFCSDVKSLIEKEAPRLSRQSVTLNLNLGRMDHSVQEIKSIVENILETLKMKFEEMETDKFKCQFISWSVAASENTWSHQRRKRRQMERDEANDEPQTKKLKLEDESPTTDTVIRCKEGDQSETSSTSEIQSSSISKSTEHYILSFDLNLTNNNSKKSLDFIWKDGESKELMHQVYQHFKNYFEKL